jgi:hypothetical protein
MGKTENSGFSFEDKIRLADKIGCDPQKLEPVFTAHILAATEKHLPFTKDLSNDINADPHDIEKLFIEIAKGSQYFHEKFNKPLNYGTMLISNISGPHNKQLSFDFDLESSRLKFSFDFLSKSINELKKGKSLLNGFVIKSTDFIKIQSVNFTYNVSSVINGQHSLNIGLEEVLDMAHEDFKTGYKKPYTKIDLKNTRFLKYEQKEEINNIFHN